MTGDRSIQIMGPRFTREEIAACMERTGLLEIEIELSAGSGAEPLRLDEIMSVIDQAIAIGCRRCVVVGNGSPLVPDVVTALASRDVRTELLSDDDCIEITSANIDDGPDLWRAIRARGREPRLQVIAPSANVSPQRGRELVQQLARIDREEFGIAWAAPADVIARETKRELYSCHVAPCGPVYPSAGLAIPIGNVRNEPLREILNLSEVLENLREFAGTTAASPGAYGDRATAHEMTGDYLAPDPLCWRNEGLTIVSLPVDVADFIPHGASMRMVDLLTSVGERRATGRFVVPRNSPLVDDAGLLDETAYVEMIAQAFAASHGFHLSAHERKMHRGLLLGVKDLVVHGHARVGDALAIEVRKLTRFGDFGIVEGDVKQEKGGTLLATGTIKVWRPSGEEQAKVFG